MCRNALKNNVKQTLYEITFINSVGYIKQAQNGLNFNSETFISTKNKHTFENM